MGGGGELLLDTAGISRWIVGAQLRYEIYEECRN